MEKTPSATARAWQPGDIAMLTLRTGVEKPAVRVEPAGEEGWVWHLLGEEFPGVAESGVTAARRLFLVDPENREHVERLVKTYNDGEVQDDWVDALQAALRSLAALRGPR